MCNRCAINQKDRPFKWASALQTHARIVTVFFSFFNRLLSSLPFWVCRLLSCQSGSVSELWPCQFVLCTVWPPSEWYVFFQASQSATTEPRKPNYGRLLSVGPLLPRSHLHRENKAGKRGHYWKRIYEGSLMN